jgi:hypothetical protein
MCWVTAGSQKQAPKEFGYREPDSEKSPDYPQNYRGFSHSGLAFSFSVRVRLILLPGHSATLGNCPKIIQ